MTAPRFPWSMGDKRRGGPLLGPGGPPPILDFNPASGGAFPATSTFQRLSDAFYFDGSSFVQFGNNQIRDEDRGTSGGVRAFLWEPKATNIHRRSFEISSSDWTKQDCSVIDNGVTAIGLRTHTLTAGSNSNQKRWFDGTNTLNIGDGITYTVTVWVTKGTDDRVAVRAGGNAGSIAWVTLNMATPSIDANAAVSTAGFEQITATTFRFWMTYTKVGAEPAGIVPIMHFAGSDTAPGTSTTSLPVSNVGTETILFHNVNVEASGYGTSVIGTSGSTGTREADSMTDVDWPATSSAVVDLSLPPVIPAAQAAHILGFGSASASSFLVEDPGTVLRLVNGGINSFVTASSSYESERHGFGMSLQTNEGIVVDDENNDNTDLTGTPGQGLINIGGNSLLQGVPLRLHRVRIYDLVQTVDDLKTLV